MCAKKQNKSRLIEYDTNYDHECVKMVGDGDGTENRVGSLERAQIAANLLDIKWSTNLSAEQGQDALANPSGDGEVVDRKSVG